MYNKLMIISTILLLSSCVTYYVPPEGEGIAKITLIPATNTGTTVTIYKFSDYTCKESEVVGEFFTNLKYYKIETAALADKEFILTYRINNTVPDFVAGGDNFNFKYAFTAFIPERNFEYEIKFLTPLNPIIYRLSPNGKEKIESIHRNECKR